MGKHHYGAALVLAVLAPVANASVTLTPHPNYPAPFYFSGTNARAFFNVSTRYPDYWVERVELKLNGELVYEQNYAQPNPIPSRNGANASVMFDSNHFATGSSVEVEFRAKVNGVWYDDSYSVPVKNRAICFGMNDLEETGWTNVHGYHPPVSVCNPTVSNLTDAGWDAQKRTDFWSFENFCDEIKQDRNIVVYSGHSNAASISSGENITTNGSGMMLGNYIYADYIVSGGPPADDILTMRIQHNGDGLPPFNSFGAEPWVYHCPPINLTFLISCGAGMENDFISFCWPFYNGYGMYFEDTGVLAFSHKVNIGDDVIVTNAAFDKLKAGWALKDAVDNIVDVAFNLGLTQELYSGGTEPYSLTNVVILGDQWTNIKNVYSPVTRTLNWFKEVPMP